MKIRLIDVIPFRIWMENGNQAAHNASHVLITREFNCDLTTNIEYLSEKTICSTVNFGQEVGSSFHVKCTAIDFFCSAYPLYVCENED